MDDKKIISSIKMDHPLLQGEELSRIVHEKKVYLEGSPVKGDIIFYIEMKLSFNNSIIKALESEVEKLSSIVQNYSDGYMLVCDSPQSVKSDEYDKCDEARIFREKKMKGD